MEGKLRAVDEYVPAPILDCGIYRPALAQGQQLGYRVNDECLNPVNCAAFLPWAVR